MTSISSYLVNSTTRWTVATAIPTLSDVSENYSYGSTTTESFTEAMSEITLDDYYYDYGNYSNFGMCVYERHGAYFLPVLYSLFFLLGLVGNALVLWVIVCGVRLRSMTDVCLLNLALADLLLVCSLPFLAHQARDQWPFGDVMCKVVLGAYHIGFYGGIFFITLMSVDRYLAIVHAVYAMRTRTRSFGMIAAAVTWTAGFLASFPELGFLQVQESPKSSNNTSLFCAPLYTTGDGITPYERHFWSIFSLFKMNILGLLIPMLIMGFCYIQIIQKLRYGQSSKKQAIRLVLVIIAVFFCCWVPYNIASFFKALELLQVYMECDSSKAIRQALQATEAIAYSHSCLNPPLYMFVGVKFRQHLLRLINRAPCRLCQVMKTFIPQDRTTGSVYSQTTSLDERSTAVHNHI